IDVIEALHKLVAQQLELASATGSDAQAAARIRAANEALAKRSDQLRERLDTILKGALVEQLDALVREADQLLVELESQVRAADQVIDMLAKPMEPAQKLEETQKQVDKLLADTEDLLQLSHVELLELEIEMDDAMLTA